MRNYLLLLIGICSMSLLTALTVHKANSGHIFKVDVEVAEDLLRREIDHYSRDGKPIYKGETDLESYSLDQVSEILVGFDEILSVNAANASISNEPAKASASNNFGNIASNATGKSKMPFFPKAKLKKVKTIADEYYDIEIDFAYGGGKGRTVVMDKITKVASIKFNATVNVSAYNRDGDELWEKEKKITEFSEVFTDPASSFEIGEKWFELSRAPILANGQKEKVGDAAAKNVLIDQYWPLSLDELRACMEIALTKTLDE